MEKTPVTVITGYLGAGKTTLLNRILTEEHGKKYALIINEFGEVGIDNDLVIDSDEEIFEMNNGCICCTVRGDLIRIIEGLMKRRDRFDSIIIETTGLADPGPVIQTFYADADVARQTKLDSIITVVDAKFIHDRLHDSREAQEQVAFADIILLNKIDLMTQAELDHIRSLIRQINPFARIHDTIRSQIDLGLILGQSAFDLDRILVNDPHFLEQGHEHEHDDDHHHCGADCDHDHHHHHHHHKHDNEVTSVSLTLDRPMDAEKFETWFSALLAAEGQNLLRGKGILAFKESDHRFVVQSVHMIREGDFERPWKDNEKRLSRLVLIGRHMDTQKLQESFALLAA